MNQAVGVKKQATVGKSGRWFKKMQAEEGACI
jgi:hypothetical protein